MRQTRDWRLRMMAMCVDVCVCEREREGWRESDREAGGKGEGFGVVQTVGPCVAYLTHSQLSLRII